MIKRLQPEITDLHKNIRTVTFSSVTLDSLQSLADRLFMAGTIISEEPFLFEGETTAKAEFEWIDGFTVDVLLKDSSELQVKRLEWEHRQSLYNLDAEHFRTLQRVERELLAVLKSSTATDYQRESSTTKLKQVRKELDGYQLDDSALKKAKGAYEQVINEIRKEQKFYGKLATFIIKRPIADL